MKVQPDSLDFALTHVIAKGDTDILPPAFEFNAIWSEWDDVRADLASQDLNHWVVRPARDCLSPKRHLGFRIATQLDPLDTLLVTALVYEIGLDLENARVPVEDEVVHSYRFKPKSDGQFYRTDFTFDSFREKSLLMAEAMDPGFVVMTDITDFFPRLYMHPLENSLHVATNKSDHVRALVRFLKAWNQNVSYGIPVGPTVFRLLAEITIDDVDRGLQSEGCTFCRFSDDYRIFVRDEGEARAAVAFLAETLFRNHGLTLQESKTEIVPTDKFLERFTKTESDQEREILHDTFEDLHRQLLEREAAHESGSGKPEEFQWTLVLDVMGYTQIEYEDLDPEQKEAIDRLNLWQVLRQEIEAAGQLDISLVRLVLRRIAQVKLEDEDDLLLSDMARLHPLFPQLIQALSIQSENNLTARQQLGERVLALVNDPIVGHLEYYRNWIISVFRDPSWNHAQDLIKLYNNYFDQLTRPEITLALGEAGQDFWFRQRKRSIGELAPWEKRAFLAGARCLPKDEAKHWYRSIKPQADPLETYVISWAQRQLANS